MASWRTAHKKRRRNARREHVDALTATRIQGTVRRFQSVFGSPSFPEAERRVALIEWWRGYQLSDTREDRVISGEAGFAARVPAEKFPPYPYRTAIWYFYMPKAHPFWDSYLMTVISLDQIEGAGPPAPKDSPHFTHELAIVGLAPEDPLAKRPAPGLLNISTWRPLTPHNIRVQFKINSAERAMDMAEVIAVAIVGGRLPIEPQGILGGREFWQAVVRKVADTFTSADEDGQPSGEAEKVERVETEYLTKVAPAAQL